MIPIQGSVTFFYPTSYKEECDKKGHSGSTLLVEFFYTTERNVGGVFFIVNKEMFVCVRVQCIEVNFRFRICEKRFSAYSKHWLTTMTHFMK